MKKNTKFKSIEKNAKNVPTVDKDILWEGEEVTAQSETKIESDTGTGQAVIIRFFEFGANPEAFKLHKPTAQELFNSHRKGIESLLWRDGLRLYEGIEPKLMFSKNKKNYRIIITCLPPKGSVMSDEPKTLSQLLIPTK
jgi:hypothetical protein